MNANTLPHDWHVCWCADTTHPAHELDVHPDGTPRRYTILEALAVVANAPGDGHLIQHQAPAADPEPATVVATIIVIAAAAAAVLAIALLWIGLANDNRAAAGLGLFGLAFVALVAAGLSSDRRRTRQDGGDQ